MRKAFVKGLSCYLIVALLALGTVPRVFAGFSPSEATTLPQLDRNSDLQTIQKALEKKMINKRLDQLGFSKGEIETRLNQLSDQEIHQLALGLDELRVGSGAFELLVIILLIAIFIGVWLSVTGHKIVI